MLGFVAMAAGTPWFFMERNDLKPELRSVATYAAVITFVAVEATTPVRYVDWLITTPLLLIEFGIIVALAGAAKKVSSPARSSPTSS